MTNRTQRLKASLFAQPREISLERALLYTASHRLTEGEPVIIRRAKATAWILDKVAISIRDDELIAGNRTVKPRAGIMSPEMDPYWLLNELDAFPTRPQDRFAISEEDKRIYRETLFPYWEKRSMKDFINGQITEEVKAAIGTQIFSVNQTDKGQGHIIIDYPRLLNNGLDALIAELKSHCARQPDNHFYQAVLILLEASQRHILRYATLAEEMAAAGERGTRAEQVMKVEQELFALYADPQLEEKPEQLSFRGGAYYSEVAVELINAIHNNLGAEMVVNTRNNGAIHGLDDDAVVETNSIIDAQGARPLAFGPLPPAMNGLTQQVKAFERLTIEAAVHGCRESALLALVANPLVGNVTDAQALLDEVLTINRQWLTQFN